jgi:hypothetical protein
VIRVRNCFLLATFVPLLTVVPVRGEGPTAEGTAFFENQVRPLLAKSCQECHGPTKQKASLRLDSRNAILRGGDHGAALVPGNPAKSLLIQAINHSAEPHMPPRAKLNAEQIAILTRWVSLGAPWSEMGAAPLRGGGITTQDRDFWSFRPVTKPTVPTVHDSTWPRNEIDTFILARLESDGVIPAPSADKRTLIRRATLDLIGLPPTVDEVNAFLVDDAPDAFAKVVDRLLASPHYGERWGRHWLDVVRYADTGGETADYPVPQTYRYRNYVLSAFNADKPYDQFLTEQIAGDLLAASGPRELYAERIVATGFVAISRRFGFDPQNYHHLTIQDTLDTLGQSVLGLSLGCARCHDHKFDPILREDYYALYGIFDSTRYAFPGSEEKKRPADFVPLLPPSELKPGKSTPASDLAYAVSEGKPHDSRIQRRGEPLDLGAEVRRRFLEILGGDPLPPNSGSGRVQLAQWLTRPENPLTARVMVNRLWEHHFGIGLVATENDFGARGQRPTHPELLDHLAVRFRESGWSIKAMHRLIMLSQVYQLSSRSDPHTATIDPENRLLSHYPRRRLDAEVIRDSILALGGKLDASVGGAHPFPPVEQWGYTQHNPFTAVYDTNRRSVYLMTQRLKRHPFLALFDGADTNASTARRLTTTVPTQSLYLMNDPFVHDQSYSFATRLLAARPDDAGRVTLACQMALTRDPSPDESADALQFLTRYRSGLKAANTPAEQVEAKSWAALVRTLFARNEFLFVE